MLSETDKKLTQASQIKKELREVLVARDVRAKKKEGGSL